MRQYDVRFTLNTEHEQIVLETSGNDSLKLQIKEVADGRTLDAHLYSTEIDILIEMLQTAKSLIKPS